MALRVACMVEGHGDREAVPILIRRIAQSIDPTSDIKVERPIRIPKSKLLRPGELERAAELAFRVCSPRGVVLVLIDSDQDCPAELAPRIIERATAARSDLTLSVVLPKSEFEAWFVTAIDSLSGYRGLRENLQPPADPEGIRGPKEWLTQHMVSDRGYRETLDQSAFSARFDLRKARECPSFDKCWREVDDLVKRSRESGD